MDKFEGLEIHSIINNRATVVAITYVIPNTAVITATGASVRHPDDRHDPELAYQLALSRALSSLARKVERHAQGRIRTNDQIAKHRKVRTTEVAKAKGNHPTVVGVVHPVSNHKKLVTV